LQIKDYNTRLTRDGKTYYLRNKGEICHENSKEQKIYGPDEIEIDILKLLEDDNKNFNAIL